MPRVHDRWGVREIYLDHVQGGHSLRVQPDGSGSHQCSKNHQTALRLLTRSVDPSCDDDGGDWPDEGGDKNRPAEHLGIWVHLSSYPWQSRCRGSVHSNSIHSPSGVMRSGMPSPGQLLTRARSSSCTSACPNVVLPVPLSRMVAPYA